MLKFLQKCQKIARRLECAIYGSRPPITSTHGSSLPERPGLYNITSQPWSDATCPGTTSWSACFRFVTLFLFEKTRQITISGVTGASCVRPWLTRGIGQTGSLQRRWARFRGDQRSDTINGALLTPSYLLAFLREHSQCTRALIWITVPKQVRKTNLTRSLYQFKKRVGKSILAFRTQDLIYFFFGFRSILKAIVLMKNSFVLILWSRSRESVRFDTAEWTVDWNSYWRAI